MPHSDHPNTLVNKLVLFRCHIDGKLITKAPRLTNSHGLLPKKLAHEMEVVMGYKYERCYSVYGRAMFMRMKMTRPNIPLNPLLKEWPRLVIMR